LAFDNRPIVFGVTAHLHETELVAETTHERRNKIRDQVALLTPERPWYRNCSWLKIEPTSQQEAENVREETHPGRHIQHLSLLLFKRVNQCLTRCENDSFVVFQCSSCKASNPGLPPSRMFGRIASGD
jgi:hypothetical protein